MNTADLIDLLSAGPNGALLAAVGGDRSWNVASDWGFGPEWTAVRVPCGVKFQRRTNGLISAEVIVTRGGERERAGHERLLALSMVPAHVVLVGGPHGPHNRLAPHFLYDPAVNDC